MFLVTDYVSNMENNSLLLDKLSRKDYHSQNEGKDIFPPHLSTAELLLGVKEGKLHQGTFRASRDNFLEGFVNCEEFKDSVSLFLVLSVCCFIDCNSFLDFTSRQGRFKPSSGW